jgi:hypothetical protein
MNLDQGNACFDLRQAPIPESALASFIAPKRKNL